MDKKEAFNEVSYQLHSSHFNDCRLGGEREVHAKTWIDEDTVDAWRHRRMYKALDPILSTEINAKWLTVGDGRYGKDAKYIAENRGYVLASDISESLLKEAKTLGYIDEYKKENAEALSFDNEKFDYVFCKESYHHFPRPMVALYEMLRVASKGVVLIEPNDRNMNVSILETIFRSVKSRVGNVLGRNVKAHDFEESGNYVYGISRREIEKVALGMNYKTVAFKGINDHYIRGVEYEKISENGKLYRKVNVMIFLKDSLAKLKLQDYGLLVTVVFKHSPSSDLRKSFIRNGYDIIDLPKNPYVQ